MQSSGAKYFATYRYSQGFKYYLKKSKTARSALIKLLAKQTRKDVKTIISRGKIPNAAMASVKAFRNMSFTSLVKEFQHSAAYLTEILKASMTKTAGR